jgi:hypothetical protein
MAAASLGKADVKEITIASSDTDNHLRMRRS